MSRQRMPASVVREVHARSEGVCEAMISGGVWVAWRALAPPEVAEPRGRAHDREHSFCLCSLP